jgi:hypothetical protein
MTNPPPVCSECGATRGHRPGCTFVLLVRALLLREAAASVRLDHDDRAQTISLVDVPEEDP